MNLNQQRRAHTETKMQAARTCETAQIIPDGLVVVVLGRQNHITLELTLNGVAAVMEMLLAVEGVRGAAMNLTFALTFAYICTKLLERWLNEF